jgi:lysozyme family protein
MADYKHIIPFIKKAEGGYVNDPADHGGETNKGITYSVWVSIFGGRAHDKFMAMTDEDWGVVFKKLFWDKILGDQFKSQRLADIMVDWVWGSGVHNPCVHLQRIINTNFGQHLVEDGVLGQTTISVLNGLDEQKLWDALVADRFAFLDSITEYSVNKFKQTHPNATEADLMKYTNKRFLKGWKNRMNNLIEFEKTGKLI